jgi:hypothetical protein
MGAWGYEIMASDNALDELDAMKDIVGRDMGDDEDAYYEEFTADELNKSMSKLLESKFYDENTFYQVLAYQIVTSGADMPQVVRDNIDSVTDENCSHWDDAEEREMRLKELRDAVHSYVDGQAVKLEQDIGLLNKIAQGMSDESR